MGRVAMDDFPEELRLKNVPPVVLQGGEEIHTVIHQHSTKISDESGTGNQISCFAYKTVAMDDNPVPRKAERRLNFEGYVPGGIMKTDWMKKQVHEYPAVWVILIDASEDKIWRSQESLLLDRLEKTKLKSRNTRILVVLLFQDSKQHLFDEKVAGIRKKIEISDKLFIMFSMDDPIQSVKRLEQNLNELSTQYYKDEARSLKKQKDVISRRNQPQLYVRNHFKIAYLAEFRSDARTALKYYHAAYNYLRDVPKNNLNLMEIKTMADYINFKVCKLLLLNSKTDLGVSEAIQQFKRHIKTYKPLTGPQQQESVHWGWISRQYQLMGELLQKFAGPGNAMGGPPGFKHPGYYFQTSASYASERKNCAIRTAKLSLSPEQIEKYKDLDPYNPIKIDYKRQRFIGQQPIDEDLSQAGAESEQQLNEMMIRSIARESQIPHSRIIIRLLMAAYEQYESNQSSRLILHLASLMAQEYYFAEKFQRAKTFFDRIAKSYRKEKWWSLMTYILRASADCAMRLGMPKDMVEYALEMSAPYMPADRAEKTEMQRRLLCIISNPAKMHLPPLNETIEVNLEPGADSLIGVCFLFDTSLAYSREEFSFKVSLTSHFQCPFRFQRLQLKFSHPEYDSEISDLALPLESDDKILTYEQDSKGLLLLPNVPRFFEFKKLAINGNTELKFTELFLELGLRPGCIRFHYQEPSIPLKNISDEFLRKKKQQFVPSTTIDIMQPRAKLKVSANHVSPALVNEFYRFDIVLHNDDNEPITKAHVTFLVENIGTNDQLDQECFFRGAKLGAIKSSEGISVSLNAGEKQTETIYVLAVVAAAKRYITVKVDYSTASYSTGTIYKFHSPVILPVSARCAFFSDNFTSAVDPQGAASIMANEPCLMRVEVQSTCPYPIKIVNADLELNEKSICTVTTNEVSRNNNGSDPCVLFNNDKYTVWFQIVPNTTGASVGLGVFKLQWSRFQHPDQLPDSDNDNKRIVITPTLIPPVKISHAPFFATVNYPAEGVLGQVFYVEISVTNETNRVEDFSLSLKDSDSFLIAGTKVSIFRVLPYNTITFTHSFIPVKVGKLQLPHFQFVSKRFAKELHATKQKRYLFIKPPIS